MWDEEGILIVRVFFSVKGCMKKLKSCSSKVFKSTGARSPLFSLRRCCTLGGKSLTGRSLNPSSKRQCVAILTLSVSTSYQRMFRRECGTHHRKIPFRALSLNRRACFPGGRTQTRHPHVRRFRRSSFLLVANSKGDAC